MTLGLFQKKTRPADSPRGTFINVINIDALLCPPHLFHALSHQEGTDRCPLRSEGLFGHPDTVSDRNKRAGMAL